MDENTLNKIEDLIDLINWFLNKNNNLNCYRRRIEYWF